ncbi:MAG: hypothetical protein JXA07_10530 [Spirochaetes bacterium]|nr:hypothetical protein [Spirochaetota bacterium]
MNCFIILLSFVLTAGQQPAPAGTGLVSRQKAFVKDLFAQKRYFDVIAETRRLMAFDPGITLDPDYEFFINANYFLGGQYRTALSNLAGKKLTLEVRERVLLSQSYMKLGMKADSLESVRLIRYGASRDLSAYTLLARKAEVYLECGKYGELMDEIAAAERYVGENEKLALLREEAGRYRELGYRSAPAAAALSALIPGAGQMYAGRYILGAASFAGVAAAAGGAWYFHRRGMSDLSYLFIAMSSLLYIGNIVGAFSAAQSANRQVDRSFRERVRKKCIPGYDPAEDARVDRIFR